MTCEQALLTNVITDNITLQLKMLKLLLEFTLTISFITDIVLAEKNTNNTRVSMNRNWQKPKYITHFSIKQRPLYKQPEFLPNVFPLKTIGV